MNVREAAQYLGITAKTLYKWKRQAGGNGGFLVFNGRAVQFRFRQTGPAGQGKITFERSWLDDLRNAMEGTVEKLQPTVTPLLRFVTVDLGNP